MSESAKLPCLPDFIWNEVFDNLDYRSLYRLLTLDRQTYAQITQFAPRFLYITKKDDYDNVERILLKVGEKILHIRDPNLFYSYITTYCPNLVSLEFLYENKKISLDYLCQIIKGFPNLTKLDIAMSEPEEEALLEIAKLKNLKFLKLPLKLFHEVALVQFLSLCAFDRLLELRFAVGILSMAIVELLVKRMPSLSNLGIYYLNAELLVLISLSNAALPNLKKLTLYSIHGSSETLDLTFRKSKLPKLASIDTNLQIKFSSENINSGKVLWPITRRAKLYQEPYNSELGQFLSHLTHLVLVLKYNPSDQMVSVLQHAINLKHLEILNCFKFADIVNLTFPLIHLEQFNLDSQERLDLSLLDLVATFAPNLQRLNFKTLKLSETDSKLKLVPKDLKHYKLIQFSYEGVISNCFMKYLLSVCPNLKLILTAKFGNSLRFGRSFKFPSDVEFRVLDSIDYLWSNYPEVKDQYITIPQGYFSDDDDDDDDGSEEVDNPYGGRPCGEC